MLDGSGTESIYLDSVLDGESTTEGHAAFVATRQFIGETKGFLLYAPFVFHTKSGQPSAVLAALIDNGADACYCDRKTADRIKRGGFVIDWGHSPPRPLTGTGHDPSNRITGWVQVRLDLDLGSFNVLFLVADRTSGLLLIGATFFITTSASIDYRSCSLRIPNQHYHDSVDRNQRDRKSRVRSHNKRPSERKVVEGDLVGAGVCRHQGDTTDREGVFGET